MENALNRRYEFHSEFQNRVLALMLQDLPFIAVYQGVMEPSYFTDHRNQLIAFAMRSYWAQYHTRPTIDALVDLIAQKNKLIPEELGQYRDKLLELASLQLTDSNYLRTRAVDFAKQAALVQAIFDCAKIIQEAPPDYGPIIRKRVEDALHVGLDITALGKALREIEVWQECFDLLLDDSTHGKRVPTKLAHLDLVMNGGPKRKTLNLIVGPPKGFKTGGLLNIAFGGLRFPNPHNVVYYTLEVSTEEIQGRAALHFGGYTKDQILADETEKCRRHYMRQRHLVGGDIPDYGAHLRIKEYPTKGATVETLHSHLSQLETLGFKPDMIVVDYADLLRPVGKFQEKHHELASIQEDLRALAYAHDAVVWTASQCNREGAKRKVLTAEFMAECYGKAMICDFAAAICQTPEEADTDAGRLFIALNRTGKQHQTIECSIRKDVMRITTKAIVKTDFDESGKKGKDATKGEYNSKG